MKLLFKFVSGSAFLALGLFVQSVSARGDADHNWPQWRGPSQTGVAPTADPPTTWSESQNIKWKINLPGTGNATPIIWGDQIFIQAAIATGKKVEPAKTADDPAPPGRGADRPTGGPGPDGKGPGGDDVHLGGSASDIVRRGADGFWRYIIDNNQGTAVRHK